MSAPLSRPAPTAPPPTAPRSSTRVETDERARKPRRRRALLIALAILLPLSLDLARPAPRQLSARGLIGAIHLYQATLSPRLGAAGVRCRFKPSCSHYAEGAIRKRGALVGSALAGWRILRCGPWTPAGTVDPP